LAWHGHTHDEQLRVRCSQAAHANGRQGTMTAAEYETEFSMWAILASPMIVTTPILNCSSTDQIAGNFTPSKCKPSLTPLQKRILLNSEVRGLAWLDLT
jgi:hypothetical protein